MTAYTRSSICAAFTTVTATQKVSAPLKRDISKSPPASPATVNFALTPGSVQQTVTVTTEAPVLIRQDSSCRSLEQCGLSSRCRCGKSAADYASLHSGGGPAAANQDVAACWEKTTRVSGSMAAPWGTRASWRVACPTIAGILRRRQQHGIEYKAATQEIKWKPAAFGRRLEHRRPRDVIPRSGGNDFHGTVSDTYSAKPLLGQQLDFGRLALGVPTPFTISHSLYEVAGGIGARSRKTAVVLLDARAMGKRKPTRSGIWSITI